jgi:hypothetical protein
MGFPEIQESKNSMDNIQAHHILNLMENKFCKQVKSVAFSKRQHVVFTERHQLTIIAHVGQQGYPPCFWLCTGQALPTIGFLASFYEDDMSAVPSKMKYFLGN